MVPSRPLLIPFQADIIGSNWGVVPMFPSKASATEVGKASVPVGQLRSTSFASTTPITTPAAFATFFGHCCYTQPRLMGLPTLGWLKSGSIHQDPPRVSNGLPHTTYRLPLGTPWRVLVEMHIVFGGVFGHGFCHLFPASSVSIRSPVALWHRTSLHAEVFAKRAPPSAPGGSSGDGGTEPRKDFSCYCSNG